MTTLDAALRHAVRLSRRRQAPHYVIRADEEDQGRYHVARETELETYWAGLRDADVLAYVSATGRIEA